MHSDRIKSQSIPYSLLLSLFYGIGLIAARFGIGQFHPLIYTGLRLVIAGFCFILIYSLKTDRAWPFRGELWRHAFVLGVVGAAIPQMAVVTSLQYQSAGITALLVTTTPAMTVVMAHFFLRSEKLDVFKGIGVLVSLGGVLLMFIKGETGLPEIEEVNAIGFSLVLFGMICNSGAGIYIRRHLRKYDSLDIAGIQVWIAAIILLVPTLIQFRGKSLQVDGLGVLSLFLGALFGIFGGYLLAFYIVKRFSATAWATAFYITPIITTFGGVLLLGEEVTGGMLFGMLLIILGLAIIHVKPPEFLGIQPW